MGVGYFFTVYLLFPNKSHHFLSIYFKANVLCLLLKPAYVLCSCVCPRLPIWRADRILSFRQLKCLCFALCMYPSKLTTFHHSGKQFFSCSLTELTVEALLSQYSLSLISVLSQQYSLSLSLISIFSSFVF